MKSYTLLFPFFASKPYLGDGSFTLLQINLLEYILYITEQNIYLYILSNLTQSINFHQTVLFFKVRHVVLAPIPPQGHLKHRQSYKLVWQYSFYSTYFL